MLVTAFSVSARVTREEANNCTLNEQTQQPYTLEQVVNAIIKVESRGNTKAFNPNGNCAGILQITPGLVKQCNIWLKAEKSTKRYTLADRYNKEKSLEMFYMVQSHYNPKGDVERAIRLWNGGPGYTRSGTQRYYKKVMSYLE